MIFPFFNIYLSIDYKNKMKDIIRPRERSSRGLPKAYIGLTKSTKIPPLLSIFDFDACYEGSTGGQIGVEINQKSTGDVGFFPALLLANQWEAENPNFLVIWSTDECEGSKWGRI